MRMEGKRGGKQVKRGGNPKDLLPGWGRSVSDAPTPFFLSIPPACQGRLALEPKLQKPASNSIIYRYEGVQYIQVTFRGFRVKKGNVEVGPVGLNTPNPTLPLNLHVPHPGAEETSHNASR